MNNSGYTHERYFTSPNPAEIPTDMPLVFLAGPVQGAPNYHDEFACDLLSVHDDIAVASPRRTSEDQRRFDSDEQVEWEIDARERAYQLGVTGIWLAAQDTTDGSYPLGRAYAQTTRIELGETLGRQVYQPDLPIVVGFDPDYSGGSEGYIRRLMRRRGLLVANSQEEFMDQLHQKIEEI